MNPDFFKQRIPVTPNRSRVTWLLDRISDRSVLHVGCVDHPIYSPDTNLHLMLDGMGNARRLDGYDIAPCSALEEEMSGTLFVGPRANVPAGYDIVLVPEVLEHVINPADLLEWCMTRGSEVIVTVPCWMGRSWTIMDNEITVHVHPEHVAWYCPATLRELGRRVGMGNSEILWINAGQMTGLHWKKGS